MAFIPRGTLSPFGAPVLRSVILGNTVTFTEFDSVKASSGFAVLGTAGALVLGHIVAMVNASGVALLTTGVAGSAIDSFVGTFLTASDNQTVAQNKGQIDISKMSLYGASESQAIGTTTGSNLLGYTQDLSTSRVLDETSALTTTGQYMGWGVDPKDSTRALVNIFESQILGV